MCEDRTICFYMTVRAHTLYDERYRKFIKALIQARKEKGLRQEDLAQILKTNRIKISRIETCDRRLDILELHDWLKALNLDIDLLQSLKSKLQP